MIFNLFFKKTSTSKNVKSSIKPAKKDQELIGKITHYFPKVKVGVFKLTKGSLEKGETIFLKGHTTDFSQEVSSMQIDHQSIDQAIKGKEIGIKFKKRVRIKDKVYKLKK